MSIKRLGIGGEGGRGRGGGYERCGMIKSVSSKKAEFIYAGGFWSITVFLTELLLRRKSEFRSCVKVEVAVLGFPSWAFRPNEPYGFLWT